MQDQSNTSNSSNSQDLPSNKPSNRARSDSKLVKENLEAQLNALQTDIASQSKRLQEQLSHLTTKREIPINLPQIDNSTNLSSISSVPETQLSSIDLTPISTNENGITNELNEVKEKQREKQQQFEKELQELQMKLLHKANERMEIEALRQRYESQLDEERETSAFHRRKVKQLELEAIELRKRLNTEMQLQNKQDLELQEMHKKLPSLLLQLEQRENELIELRKENQRLEQQFNSLLIEFQTYKHHSQSTADQEQKVRVELEQTNQRLIDELLNLTSKLSDYSQQLNDLRLKREIDLEILRKESIDKAALEITLSKVERENRDLQSSLSSNRNSQSNLSDTTLAELQKIRLENETIRSELASVKQQKEDQIQQLYQALDLERNKSQVADQIHFNHQNWQELTTKQSEEIKRLTELLETERSQRQSVEELNHSIEHELSAVKERLIKIVSDSDSSNNDSIGSASHTPLKSTSSYTAVKGDEVDSMLAGIINQLTDGIELLPPNFSRLKRGTYRFGTKQITIQIQNGQPVVRVGGGFMPFTQFVKKNGKIECMKLSKDDQSY